MKYFGLMVLALVLALAPAASAQTDGFYVTPKAGFSNFYGHLTGSVSGEVIGEYRSWEDSARWSFTEVLLAIAGGYSLQSATGLPLRAEAEFAWRGSTANYSIGIMTIFANGYYDFYNVDFLPPVLTPYAGIGLGLSRLTFDYWDAATSTNLAWNIGGGVVWKLKDDLSLDFGVRYAKFGSVESSATYNNITYKAEVDLDGVEMMVGARFSF